MQQKTESMVDVASPKRQLGLEHLTQRIAQALFEARGCVPGHELDDWLKAESLVEELLSDMAQAVSRNPSLRLTALEEHKAVLVNPSVDPASVPWRA